MSRPSKELLAEWDLKLFEAGFIDHEPVPGDRLRTEGHEAPVLMADLTDVQVAEWPDIVSDAVNDLTDAAWVGISKRGCAFLRLVCIGYPPRTAANMLGTIHYDTYNRWLKRFKENLKGG